MISCRAGVLGLALPLAAMLGAGCGGSAAAQRGDTAGASMRHPGAPLPELEVRLEEPGSYRTAVEVGGRRYECPRPIREGEPCFLTNVNAGFARVELESTEDDHHVRTPTILRSGTEALVVEEGVTTDGATGYMLLGMALLFAGPGTYLLLAADCDPSDRNCRVTPLLGGTFATIGGVFGLLGTYLLTFGNPYELYAGDARREHRPAVSPDSSISIDDPVGDPAQRPGTDSGATEAGGAPPPPAPEGEPAPANAL